MKNELTQILRHYFNKGSVEELEESEVRNLADQFPYFTAGHVILAKYLQHSSSDSADTLSKSALYLCNPIWLNAFIEDEQPLAATTISVNRDELFLQNQQEEELIEDESEIMLAGVITGSIDVVDDEKQFTVIDKTEAADYDDQRDPVLTRDAEQAPESEPLVIADTEVETDFIESIQLQEEVQPATAEAALSELNEEAQLGNDNIEESPAFEPAEIYDDTPASTELSSLPVEEQQSLSDSTEAGFLEPDVVTEGPAADESDLENTADQIAQPAIEKPQSRPDVQEVPTADVTDPGQLAFEPFHTVDYFASQGIKLQQAEMGQDKLGKQLRSFTEWLRSMKRLPQTEAGQSDDTSIHRIAEHSLEDKEILTVAMAEVWLKQGNREKAAAIYRKLSLQNPSKSSYFAAKIEQLNSL